MAAKRSEQQEEVRDRWVSENGLSGWGSRAGEWTGVQNGGEAQKAQGCDVPRLWGPSAEQLWSMV
jgi:hypothetical protein